MTFAIVFADASSVGGEPNVSLSVVQNAPDIIVR